MNDHQGAWWNILDTVTGLAVGIVSLLGVVFGWLGNKFTKVDNRMDALEKDFNRRNQIAATSITRLEAYHESNIQRLDSIDQKLDRLLDSMMPKKRGR